MNFKNILFLVVFFYFNTTNAQTKVASIFSDNMVLQQNTEVSVWGSDVPNLKITVETSWGEKKSVISDENGKWKIFIKTKKAENNTPHTLKIQGSEKVILKNILLGEVWLASGQSNMEMPIKGFKGQPINGSNEFVLNSKNANLRIFNIKKKPSLKPLKNVEGNWKEATPEAVFNFSAVAYLYGKILQQNINVPVGIICSSFGGTRVEAWTDKVTLEKSTLELDLRIRTENIKTLKNSPSVLYNGMIHPIIPFAIKGVVWYQGESNRGNAAQYKSLFTDMITSWRQEWNIGDFPFYFVQIAPFQYKPINNSAYLREAQLQTMQTVANTGMAVTLDIGEEFFIHPPEKELVAKRLAYWALAENYGFKGIQFSGPIYKSMKIDKNAIQLDFDYAPQGVTSLGKELHNFTIAGADKVFYPAEAKIVNRNKVVVNSDKVQNPVAVRYAWKNWFTGSLYGTNLLPVSSFRTDNWTDAKKINKK